MLPFLPGDVPTDFFPALGGFAGRLGPPLLLISGIVIASADAVRLSDLIVDVCSCSDFALTIPGERVGKKMKQLVGGKAGFLPKFLRLGNGSFNQCYRAGLPAL